MKSKRMKATLMTAIIITSMLTALVQIAPVSASPEGTNYAPFGTVLYIWGADGGAQANVMKWWYLGTQNGGDGNQWDGHKITIVNSQWPEFNGQFYLKNTGTNERFTLWRDAAFTDQVTTTNIGYIGSWEAHAAYAIDDWVEFNPEIDTVGDPRETVGELSHMYYGHPEAGSGGGNLEVKLNTFGAPDSFNGRYLDLVECGWTDLNGGWFLKFVLQDGPTSGWYELYHDADFTEPGIPAEPAKFVSYGGTEGYLYANSGYFVAPYEVWVDDTGDDSNAGTENLPFATINKGIDMVADGGTVYVAAGEYDEWITIDKGLTLLGASAGIHPAVGTHPIETVGPRGIEGLETILSHAGTQGVKLQAEDITIDGFMFTGAGYQSIVSQADANNFHLTNCIFDNYEEFVSGGVLQLPLPHSHKDMLIDFNLFQDQGASGFGGTIYAGGDFSGLRIAYNKFNVLGDSVVWTDPSLVDGIIEGNEFDGTIEGVPGVGFGTLNIGKGGNIIIRNNWFHDIFYTSFQVGIVGGSVTGNTFERIYPYGVYGGDAFQLWGGQWGTAVSTNVLIEDNTINYNDVSTEYPTHGIRLRAPEGESAIDGSTIHIHDNNFIDGGYRTDAFAIRHQGDPETIVDAEMNYWTTAIESEIIEMFSGPVDYDPWFGKQPKVEETESGDDVEVDALDEADTVVVKDGEGTPTVSVAEFTENPETGFSNEAGKFYDVKIDDETDVDSLTLKFYYTDADLGGRDESTMSMLWHDGTSWVPCSHQTLHTVSDISGYSGYIEVYVAAIGTTPLLSQMTGTPFGVEGEWPEVAEELCDLSVSGEVIVEAAEDVTYVYASMGDTAEITVELGLEGYHGDIYFTLYKKVDGGLAYIDEIRTVYGIELKGSRTASWIVDQNPGNYVVWINIDLMEKVQLTGLDEALHIGPIEVVIS